MNANEIRSEIARLEEAGRACTTERDAHRIDAQVESLEAGATGRADASEIIRTRARGRLAEELRYRVEELERDPADWPDGYDYLDALSDVDGTDFSRAPAIRREITRLQRLIGMEEQVRPGQEILEMSQGRCRRLRAGEWHTVRAYYEF